MCDETSVCDQVCEWTHDRAECVCVSHRDNMLPLCVLCVCVSALLAGEILCVCV